MNTTNPNVDFYFNKATNWHKEIKKLRTIVLDCGLTEQLKWGVPCYTFLKAASQKESNVVLIHTFKEYCALLFFKGALLNDAQGILIQQTENVQAGRQIRFTHLQEIVELEPVLKAYIYEAVEIEKSGLKVAFEKSSDLVYTQELQNKLDENPDFKIAFEAPLFKVCNLEGHIVAFVMRYFKKTLYFFYGLQILPFVLRDCKFYTTATNHLIFS